MVRKLAVVLLGAVSSFLSFSPAHAAPAPPAALPVVNVSGALSHNAEWVNSNVYVVTGTVTVQSGVTLTVDPGTIVKFNGGQALVVDGTLSATGTSGSPIYFTSYRDDQVGGNTGGNGPQPSDWSSLVFDSGSSAQIDFVTLRYSGAGNVAAFQAPTYTVPVIGNNVTLTSNWGNAIELPGGQPPTNSTELKSYGAPYLVINTLTVPSGATLTIDPGAMLKFWFGAGIVVNGSLSATGSAGAPIYFTAVRDALVGGNTVPSQGTSPAPSDWSNLVFAAGSTAQIDFVTLRYSGAGNVAAFQAPTYTVPVIGNNVTLTSNWANAIELPGGQPPTNTELKSFGAPYLVISTITVPSGATFTIDPGVILKFWFGTGIVVDGTLSATGAAGAPIYFTSVRDALVGGNTVPSQGTSPAPSDWSNLVFAAGSSAHVDFATLRYSGAGNVAAFQAPGYTVPVIGNNVTLTSNWGNAIELPGGQPPTNNTELKSYGAPYLVISTLTVPSGATFTIDPGAILKFWFGTGIVVNGTLSATGSSGVPIYFTSVRDALVGGNTVPTQGTSPAASDWSNLVFAAGSTARVDFATLRYSGAGNVAVFQAPGYTVPVIGNNITLTSNWGNAIELPGGQPPTNNTELKSYGTPYLVISSITVPLGATFTIDPGAILKFWFGTGIVVNGALSAAGTAGSPIEVTSIRDAQIGGNTVPSQGTSPAPGDWSTISVAANGSASLSNALLRYGGNGALSVASGTLTATQSCLTNNSVGLLATSAGASITNSWIYNNSSFGVQASSTAPVTATNNWWGATSGPFNSVSNPKGTGNQVSAGVTYVPFVTTSTTCPFPFPPCTPRPQIALAVTPNGHNGLQVSLTDTGQNVLLESLQFGAAVNGLIDMPPTLNGSGGNVTVPLGGVSQVANFTVRQQVPGGAVTVPFTIVDQCGAWPTFVGGGPAAFASAPRVQTDAAVVLPRPSVTPESSATVAGTGASDGDPRRSTSPPVVGSAAHLGNANSAAPFPTSPRSVVPVTADSPLTPQTTGQAAAPAPAPAGDATGSLSVIIIDPALGGSFATSTGDAALTIPSGATSDSVQFTLADVSLAPTDVPPTTPDWVLGTTLVQIGAQDRSVGTVVSFEVPVTVTVAPNATDLQTVGGDPTALALATFDPASGSWQILPTTVNSDGSLSAEVTAPGVVTILEPSAAPAASGTAPAD